MNCGVRTIAIHGMMEAEALEVGKWESEDKRNLRVTSIKLSGSVSLASHLCPIYLYVIYM
jgi:hypothetical protein